MRKLTGKRALVTGAAGGIGRAICRRLASREVELVVLDLDHKTLQPLVSELTDEGHRVEQLTCDLSDPAAVDAVASDLLQRRPLDILINNAGVGHYGPLREMTTAQWDRVLDVNLLAPIRLTQHLLPMLMSRPEAHVVNMCSMLAMVPVRRLTAYCTTKAALTAYTESLRVECAGTHVGVSAMCPGFVWTDFFARFSNSEQRQTPIPPKWVCTTADRLAAKVERAIRRNRRLMLATPLAYAIHYLRRLSPGLLVGLQRLSRKKRSLDWTPPHAAPGNDESRAA